MSRQDGDILTLDLRTRTPNDGDYMNNQTMHSMKHMSIAYIRNSNIGDRAMYFGPMGCQTVYYLCVRGLTAGKTAPYISEVLQQIIDHKGDVYGATRQECGRFKNLSLKSVKLQ